MKVVITGANGAVGYAILTRGMLDTSHTTLIAAVRSDRAAAELPPLSNGQVARVSYDDSTSLKAAFQGASAVIHLVGILVEQPGFSYESANVETTRRVTDAAVEASVRKLVYVSATGADESSSNRYWRSKGEAEVIVRNAKCLHTILRVPLLLGPRTEGAAGLRRHLSRSVVVLPGGGRNMQQPLDVDDLARAALHAADPAIAVNTTLDLVGPISLQDRDIVQRAARALDRHVTIRSVPITLVRLGLLVQRLVGSPKLSPDVLEVITANTQLDPTPAATQLAIRLTGIDEMISRSVR